MAESILKIYWAFFGPGIVASALLAGGGALYCYNRASMYSRLEKTTIELADKNHDGNVSSDEWMDVYKTVGVKYSAVDPQKLSRDQLRKYIDIASASKK
jgi:hypothetical protein